MKNTFNKIWNIFSTILVVLIVLCAVFLMGSRLIGYQCYTVLTGSMEPEYSPGDLIYVKQVYTKDIGRISDKAERDQARMDKVKAVQAWVDNGTLEVNDVITFMKNETTVATHRIVEIDTENKQIYTKGDTNETIDSPVLYENIIGEVHFSIPKLGYVSNAIQTPPGMYIALAAGVVLILLVFLPDMLTKKKKADQEQEVSAAQAEVAATNEENERLKAELERLKAETHFSSGEMSQIAAQKQNENGEN